MALYKIMITKIKPTHRNPFRMIHVPLHSETSVDCRTWEAEAENENEILNFFREAKEKDFPSVRGYEMHSIVLVEP